jgi:hypothetical protein
MGATLPSINRALLRPANNQIALIGHSMADNCMSLGISGGQIRQILFHANVAGFISMLSKGRYTFPEDCKFAVGSTKTSDIISTALTSTNRPNGVGVGFTQLQMAVSCPASIVFLWTGTNDASGGISLATTIANFRTILNTLTAAGKIVILIGPTPRGSTAGTSFRLTGSQLQILMALREWLVRQAPLLWPGLVYCVDLWTLFADLSSSATAGDIVAADSYDQLHPSALGAWKIFQIALLMLDRLGLPGAFSQENTNGEAYDATNNPRGNLIPSAATQALLYGTGAAWSGTSGGAVFAGTKASLLTSVLSGVAGSSAITFTGSMVTTSTGQWWQIVVSGTSIAGSNQYTLLYFSNILRTNLNAGDKIAQFGEFEIDSGGVGLAGLAYVTQRSTAAGTDTVALGYGDGSKGAFDTILAAGMLSGTWNGDQPTTISGDETVDIKNYFQINVMPSTTVNFTFRVRNLAVRKTYP